HSCHLLHTITTYPFSYTAPPPPEIYTLSLHDALPISTPQVAGKPAAKPAADKSSAAPQLGATAAAAPKLQLRAVPYAPVTDRWRSEEHTSELQSRFDLVCRLLLEKKKKPMHITISVNS